MPRTRLPDPPQIAALLEPEPEQAQPVGGSTASPAESLGFQPRRRRIQRFEDIPARAGVRYDADTGEWYRVVPTHTGQSVTVDGRLHHTRQMVRRPIALTLEDAKRDQADFWDGLGWIRRGQKPEYEHPLNLGGTAPDTVLDEFLEPASAEEQAAARQEAQRRLREVPAIPEDDQGRRVAHVGDRVGEGPPSDDDTARLTADLAAAIGGS